MSLVAENISFSYPGHAARAVLEAVDLNLQPGERVALLGESGVGKTTFGKILGGYLAPARGRVVVDGEQLPTRGPQPVQLIWQHPEMVFDPRLTMKKSLAEAGCQAEKLLQALGIESAWLNRFPRELSGGELQRFSIARALGSATKYLITDEITAKLDPISQAQIWEFLLEWCAEREIGILVITHDAALAAKIAHRVIHFD